jgi:hypothetical protein
MVLLSSFGLVGIESSFCGEIDIAIFAAGKKGVQIQVMESSCPWTMQL